MTNHAHRVINLANEMLIFVEMMDKLALFPGCCNAHKFLICAKLQSVSLVKCQSRKLCSKALSLLLSFVVCRRFCVEAGFDVGDAGAQTLWLFVLFDTHLEVHVLLN